MTTEVWPTSVHHFVRPRAETSCRSPQKILISLIEDSGKALWLKTAPPFIWTLSVTTGAPSTSERHCLCYSRNIVHVTPENTYFSYKTYYLLSVILFSKSHRMFRDVLCVNIGCAYERLLFGVMRPMYWLNKITGCAAGSAATTTV